MRERRSVTPCVVGKRKRPDEDGGTSPRPRKKLKTSNPDLRHEDPFYNSKDGPRYIGRKAMMAVREHIFRLTKREWDLKADIKGLRGDFIKMLNSSISLRRKILQGLAHPNIEEDMRQRAKLLLVRHKAHMLYNEEQLIRLEKILPGFGIVNILAENACAELDEKIGIWANAEEDPNYTINDFPRIMELVEYTHNAYTPSLMKDRQYFRQITTTAEGKEGFALFSKLPAELRLHIWRMSLGESRIVTHDSKHNKALTLLSTCRESRQVVEDVLPAILSPDKGFALDPPSNRTLFSYANPDTDIIMRDLAKRDLIPRDPSGSSQSLFDLEGEAFNLSCQTMLTGLSKVKNLALAFDIFKTNGGRLFPSLQACCPILETLKIFPNSQLDIDPHRPINDRPFRFIEFDSNFADLIAFERSRRLSGIWKRKSRRAIEVLDTLSGYIVQYRRAFPRYITQFGQEWSPALQICMLVRWSDSYQGWQTGGLDFDYYSNGYRGENGDHYFGFTESCVVCGADGEMLSRYDGVKELFGET
ncbi:hypothetical protein B0O99DRAFT_689247 [Bisporella sp. PMI_857]|nr:hypothetical protein B0O99DRAFT_689247 [Bisporella sp. PMI_857]